MPGASSHEPEVQASWEAIDLSSVRKRGATRAWLLCLRRKAMASMRKPISVGELALVRMLGEHVAVFDLDGFADAVGHE